MFVVLVSAVKGFMVWLKVKTYGNARQMKGWELLIILIIIILLISIVHATHGKTHAL